MTAVAAPAVDVDVHCAPSSIAQLAPYLDNYWRDYFAGAEADLSPTFGRAYPLAARTTARRPPDQLEVLQGQLLDGRAGGVSILTCITAFSAGRNPYCEAAVARAVNDWLRDEWLERDPRLRGSIAVPTVDVDAAVDEIDRLGVDGRFVQVLLPVRGLDARWGNVRFRKILAAAARHDLVVGLHAWGGVGSSPTAAGFTHTYLEDYLTNSQTAVQAQLVSLIAEGVFDELPQLRIAMLECGFSWIPGLMWRFDKDWKALWREVPWMKGKPSDYLYRHVRFSTQPAHLPRQPERARELLDMMRAADLLMFASDHPHDHGRGGERLFDALDEQERAAVFGANATEFYRLAGG
jgi:predicted TIM-barrel fold metal-dependent hydrolase